MIGVLLIADFPVLSGVQHSWRRKNVCTKSSTAACSTVNQHRALSEFHICTCAVRDRINLSSIFQGLGVFRNETGTEMPNLFISHSSIQQYPSL
jgi:hypothetical protein